MGQEMGGDGDHGGPPSKLHALHDPALDPEALRALGPEVALVQAAVDAHPSGRRPPGGCPDVVLLYTKQPLSVDTAT